MELQLGFSLGLGKFMGDLATTKYGSMPGRVGARSCTENGRWRGSEPVRIFKKQLKLNGLAAVFLRKHWDGSL